MHNEYRQVKQYAKSRLQQKHERKLFRPQTGVAMIGHKTGRNSSRQEIDLSIKTPTTQTNQLSSGNFIGMKGPG